MAQSRRRSRIRPPTGKAIVASTAAVPSATSPNLNPGICRSRCAIAGTPKTGSIMCGISSTTGTAVGRGFVTCRAIPPVRPTPPSPSCAPGDDPFIRTGPIAPTPHAGGTLPAPSPSPPRHDPRIRPRALRVGCAVVRHGRTVLPGASEKGAIPGAVGPCCRSGAPRKCLKRLRTRHFTQSRSLDQKKISRALLTSPGFMCFTDHAVPLRGERKYVDSI